MTEALATGAQYAAQAVSGAATVNSRNAYLGLYTTAPTDALVGTELTTPGQYGYTRQLFTWSQQGGDPYVIQNSGIIAFGPFTTGIPSTPIVAAVLSNSSSGGTQFFVWDISSTVVESGDYLRFPVGALKIQAD